MVIEVESHVQTLKRFYVYELRYPKSMGGAVFYVGKGQRRKTGHGLLDRVDEHERDARKPLETIVSQQGNIEKYHVIHSIWAASEEVVKEKVFFTDDESEAYDWETKRIQFYGVENLTNKPRGGKPWSNDRYCSDVSIQLPPVKQDKVVEVEIEEEDYSMTAEEAATYMKVRPRLIVRLAEKGELVSLCVDNLLSIRKSDIKKYIEEQKLKLNRKAKQEQKKEGREA